MPVVVADLVARLRGDTSQFSSAMASAQGAAVSGTAKISSSFLGMGAAMLKGFAAFAAIDFIGDAVREAEEAATVLAQTEAVIKSTGGVAGLTATNVGKLSDKVARLAAVDDEQVQAGANMLLTFKNIDKQIFGRSLKAMTDMAAGMAAASGGTMDLKSASIQLGKALNDPMSGMTALQRVGVQFSDSQKQAIADFTAMGDLASAQKIILQEVESQFAGSAAAQATASDRLKVSWEQLKETAGAVLVPALQKLFDHVLIPAFNWVSAHKEDILGVFRTLGGIVEGAFNIARDAWNGVLKPVLRDIKTFFEHIWTIVTKVAGAIEDVVTLGGVIGGPTFGDQVAAFKKANAPKKKRQRGGPVSMGSPYIVGEAGPELFVPNASGGIVPNHKLGGGGLTVIVNVAGTVVSEGRLADKLHELLLAKQRKSGRLGFN